MARAAERPGGARGDHRPAVSPAGSLSRARLGALIVAGVVLCSTCWAIARVPNLVVAPRAFLALFTLALLAYAGGAVAARGQNSRGVVVVILAAAIVARLLLLPSAPSLSTDAYRYVWDARLASAGVDPYAYAPTAPEVAGLRDSSIYPRLNHPTWYSVYPPLAETFFRLVYGLAPDSVRALKVALGIAELAALAALVLLLRTLGLPMGQLVIYAWSPLVLVEVWGSGHLDALVLLAVTAAALASARRRDALAAGFLAAGALVKIYPAVLFLLLPGRRRAAVIGAFAGVVVVGSFVAGGFAPWPVAAITRYARDEYFNPGLVRTLVNDPRLPLVASLAWVLVVAWRRGTHLSARATLLVAGVIVLAPNVFPWYALWLVPFLAVTPSVPLIAFTGAVGYAYSFFLPQPWAIPPWARLVEAAPVALAVALWLYAVTARFRGRARAA